MVVRVTLVLVLFGIAFAVDPPNPDGRAPPAQGSGSLAQVIIPRSAKTMDKHVAHANNSILLWCGAKQRNEDVNFLKVDKVRWSKFPNDNAPLSEATEVTEYGNSEVAPNNTFSLNLDHAPVTAAGKYRCDLWNGGTFLATGNMFVYMRPVFVQEEYQRLDSIDDKNIYEVDGGGYTVTEGGSVSLTCRAVGYPEIKYRWEKNGVPLKTSKHYTINKEVLNITDVTEDDRAVFKCIASNSFRVKDASQTYESSVAFHIRVKGKLAWLWPLIAIIVTALLLAIIIIACEYRRKKHEQEAREQLDPEEED